MSKLQNITPLDGETWKGTSGDDNHTGTSGDDTLIGKSGNDTIDAGKGDDLIVVKDFGGTDNIDGGVGDDTLRVKQAVDIDFTSTTVSMQGIETLQLGNKADHLVLANDMDTGARHNTLAIRTGGGQDSVDASHLDGTGVRVDVLLGSGSDTLSVGDHSLAGNSFDGGVGYDVMQVVGGGVVDLSTASSIANFEMVQVDDSATNLTLTDDGMTVDAGGNAATRIIGGAGDDDITIGAAGQVIETGGGDNVVHATIADLAGPSGTTALLGDSYDPTTGSGYDTLSLSGGGVFDPQNFTLIGFDELDFDGSTYTVDLTTLSDDLTVQMGNGNSTLTTGSGDYYILGGVNGQTVDMSAADSATFLSAGNGVDHVIGSGSSAVVALGGGDDIYTVSDAMSGTLDGALNGGTGADTLQVSLSGGGCVTLGTGVVGFETVDLSGSTGGVDLSTNNQAFHVIGSDYGDTVSISNNAQSFSGGAGDDTLDTNGTTISAAEVYDGGTGYDYVQVDNSGVNTLGAGVTGIEEVDIYDASTVHLTNQGGPTDYDGSDLVVYAEGGGNKIYMGSGSGFDVTLDEADSYVDLESADNVSLTSNADGIGGDTIQMGTGTGEDIQLSSEDDLVYLTQAALAGYADPINPLLTDYNTIAANGGADTLGINVAGTWDFTAANAISAGNVTGFENVLIDNVAANVTLDNSGWVVDMGNQSAVTVTGGTGADTFNFGANGQTAAGGAGNDAYVLTSAQLTSGHITEAAAGGSDSVEITTGGTFTLSTANVETFTLDEASNVTVALTSTTTPGGYTLDGSAGTDSFTIGSSQLFSGVSIDGGGNGLAGDTIVLTTAGAYDFTAAGVSVNNVENVTTGVNATNLVLDDDGYTVNVDGGQHTITSGATSGDYFDFSGVGSYLGVHDTINAFDEGAGAGHDTLDLSAFNLSGYGGEFATSGDAWAYLATHHGTAVFDQATDTLYVDLQGNGTVGLEIGMTGVNDLAVGTDLVI